MKAPGQLTRLQTYSLLVKNCVIVTGKADTEEGKESEGKRDQDEGRELRIKAG